jgi:hypothetical protein
MDSGGLGVASTRNQQWLRWLQLVAMSLVTFYGVAGAKEFLDGYDEVSQMAGRDPERGARRWILATVPLFVWWSVAILALGLVARAGWRIWRRPGIVPGVVVLLFMSRNVIESAVLRLRFTGPPALEFWSLLGLATPSPGNLVSISHSAGMAVASSWLALWIGGWWHPAPTWNDRAGRALGCYWIAVCLVDPFHSWIL